MKRLVATLVFALCVCSFAKAEASNASLMASKEVVWAGLDYSLLHVIAKSNDIKVPELIFEDMPKKWNDLFLEERLEDVALALDKRILLDLKAITERNQTLATNRNIFIPADSEPLDKPNMSREVIASTVRSYNLEHTNGLGLVFIVEKFLCHHRIDQFSSNNRAYGSPVDHLDHIAVINVVFFNIATREIISLKREVATAGASGNFRYRWFDPIKTVDDRLKKYR